MFSNYFVVGIRAFASNLVEKNETGKFFANFLNITPCVDNNKRRILFSNRKILRGDCRHRIFGFANKLIGIFCDLQKNAGLFPADSLLDKHRHLLDNCLSNVDVRIMRSFYVLSSAGYIELTLF